MIDNNGNVANYQEGLGLAYAVIFGIVDKPLSSELIKNAKTSNFGITSIYPDFPRFSHNNPGRHNNIIWPMVNGFFAKAAIIAGDKQVFDKELKGLTTLALDEDKGNYQFLEIYNPYTGKPDGGWQQGDHWHSCMHQTWSATAYLDMVDKGLLGMRITEDGISFSPYLPDNVHLVELKNLTYRNATLDITVKGKGSSIKRFTVNNKSKSVFHINGDIKGHQAITIELE